MHQSIMENRWALVPAPCPVSPVLPNLACGCWGTDLSHPSTQFYRPPPLEQPTEEALHQSPVPWSYPCISSPSLLPILFCLDGSLSLPPSRVLFGCGCFCKHPVAHRLAGAEPGPGPVIQISNEHLHAVSASPRSCSGPACGSPCLSCCLQMSLPMLAQRPEPGSGAPSCFSPSGQQWS